VYSSEALHRRDPTSGVDSDGGIAHHANGALEAGFDPRSDGGVAGF